MKRRILTLFCCLMLALCAASIGFAIRGSWRTDAFSFSSGSWRTAVLSSNGGLVFRQVKHQHAAPARWTSSRPWGSRDEDSFLVMSGVPGTWFSERSLLGIHTTYGTANAQTDGFVHLVPFRILVIPFWMIAIATAFAGLWLPLQLRRAYRKRRALRAGLCLSCGYDLRASRERCPECGTSVIDPNLGSSR